MQPLLTALIASLLDGRATVTRRQWLGIAVGFAGVVLVVWHKIDIREMTLGSLCAVIVALLAVTAGTFYQRVFCHPADLRSAPLLQFAASAAVLAPLAWVVEGFRITWAWPMFAAIVFLVICASILAVSALHTLMRHGEATRVTSLFYLTPVFAVVLEFACSSTSSRAWSRCSASRSPAQVLRWWHGNATSLRRNSFLPPHLTFLRRGECE